MELGIACEACHGPAEEHVRFYQSPVRRYLRYFRQVQDPDACDPTIVNPEKLEDKATEATERWLGFGGLDQARPHLLIAANSEIDVYEWLRLLAERNQRPLAIIE